MYMYIFKYVYIYLYVYVYIPIYIPIYLVYILYIYIYIYHMYVLMQILFNSQGMREKVRENECLRARESEREREGESERETERERERKKESAVVMSLSHVTHVPESCHTCDWGMSHRWLSQVTHVTQLYPTQKCVMSRISVMNCYRHKS